MVDHRVHVPSADREEQPRATEPTPIVTGMPIGLADDPHAITGSFQNPAQDRHRETGVIDVRIPGDKHDIQLVPASLTSFLHGHWQRRGRDRPVGLARRLIHPRRCRSQSRQKIRIGRQQHGLLRGGGRGLNNRQLHGNQSGRRRNALSSHCRSLGPSRQ